eukprot:8632933-Pyramimonas_sp.AAC.1
MCIRDRLCLARDRAVGAPSSRCGWYVLHHPALHGDFTALHGEFTALRGEFTILHIESPRQAPRALTYERLIVATRRHALPGPIQCDPPVAPPTQSRD